MTSAKRIAVALVRVTVGMWGLAGCTPNVPKDVSPEAMEFDPQGTPPRVPQPTSLIVNRQTGLIDFSLAGIAIPMDCAKGPRSVSEPECAFDQYLQTLDGFPSVTPAQTPASTALDPDTLILGTNVVVVAAKSGSVVTDAVVGFDTATRNITLRPGRSWTVGESYWVGVRGYANGVRAVNGREVVGSPTQFLLKQDTALTCGATDPSHIDPACPAMKLLVPGRPPAESEEEATAAAAKTVFQLEAIRQFYRAGWTLMNDVGGLPKSETAVLWNFGIHTASVAELDPTVGLVPLVTAMDEIRVPVKGTVDPATVKPFVNKVKYGTVVVMDLTAAQSGDAIGTFPAIDAKFVGDEIVIKGQAPFTTGNQYGIFFTNGILNERGDPLVPSPISVLLRLRQPLVTANGRSEISTISDANAAMLEEGRSQLARLFNDPTFSQFTGVTREQLVYCIAIPFAFTGAP